MFTGTRYTLINSNVDANRNGSTTFGPLPAGTYTGSANDGLEAEFDGGRNGATGPGFFQFDTRLSYDVRAGGKAYGAYVELLNVTNHANFSNPGNDQRLTTFLNPTSIFGGTPPRTLQAGLRLTF